MNHFSSTCSLCNKQDVLLSRKLLRVDVLSTKTRKTFMVFFGLYGTLQILCTKKILKFCSFPDESPSSSLLSSPSPPQIVLFEPPRCFALRSLLTRILLRPYKSLCGEQLHTNTRKTYIIFWTLWLMGPENY